MLNPRKYAGALVKSLAFPTSSGESSDLPDVRKGLQISRRQFVQGFIAATSLALLAVINKSLDSVYSQAFYKIEEQPPFLNSHGAFSAQRASVLRGEKEMMRSVIKETDWMPPASGEEAYRQRFEAPPKRITSSDAKSSGFAPLEPPPFAPVPVERISSGVKGRNRVALTFDTEKNAGAVPQIVAALKAAKVKATFFVVGAWAEIFPDLFKMIVADGHEIASHSYSHPMMTTIPTDAANAQIMTTERVLYSLSGRVPVRMFRPPYGDYDERILDVAASLGYKTILWSNDPIDWQYWQTGENVYALVTDFLTDGDIVLLHTSSLATGDALPGILNKMKEMGLRQVAVSEILK